MNMDTITIKVESYKDVSDGYHTIQELYDHRIELFIALMRSHPEISWRANVNADGTKYDGWFVAGMHLPNGDISYHLPEDRWTDLDNRLIPTSWEAPSFDGHTANDVIERLKVWSKSLGAKAVIK
jgi:hypothetical protein